MTFLSNYVIFVSLGGSMSKAERDLTLIMIIFVFIIVVHSLLGCAPEHVQHTRVNQDVYVTTPAGETILCPPPKEDNDRATKHRH